MDKTIKIEVYGGCVTEVTGLPEGWEYEIVDHAHSYELGSQINIGMSRIVRFRYFS